MNLAYLNNDEAENEYDNIWMQAKTLEYMALSMLQRQRFFSTNNVLGLQARTFKQCDKMIERVFQVFEKDLNKKQLSFLIQIDLKFTGIFLAEWELYELILFHLIGNAVKFSNSGGSITVVLSPRETISEQGSQTTLKTVVRDRGIGISEERLAKIKSTLKV